MNQTQVFTVSPLSYLHREGLKFKALPPRVLLPFWTRRRLKVCLQVVSKINLACKIAYKI